MRNVNDDLCFLKEKFSLESGDIIYVVSHKKQQSLQATLLDFITGGVIHIINSYQGGACWYLIATSESGVIYRMTSDKQVIKVGEIKNWSLEKKENFNKETTDGICYKKIRRVLVE